MRAAEQGFLLLGSRLGNPDRKPLTVAQMRDLARAVGSMEKPTEQRDLTPQDLTALGCSREMAEHIVALLSDSQQLSWYLERGRSRNCIPVTRIDRRYPAVIRKKLGLESPACLWMMGNPELLQTPCVSLAGCRNLLEPNRAFAEKVGAEAARQGYTLVSGNARGADQAAQNACLRAGGSVISIVADSLSEQTPDEHILYVSEDGYDEPFTAWRAHSRNRLIHCLGEKTFIAMSEDETGGSWAGTVRNLQQDYSPVFCFQDGSAAMEHLSQLGANLISLEDLSDFDNLQSKNISFF